MICKCLPLLQIANNLCSRISSMPMQGSISEPRAPMSCKCRLLLLMANNLWSQSLLQWVAMTQGEQSAAHGQRVCEGVNASHAIAVSLMTQSK